MSSEATVIGIIAGYEVAMPYDVFLDCAINSLRGEIGEVVSSLHQASLDGLVTWENGMVSLTDKGMIVANLKYRHRWVWPT